MEALRQHHECAGSETPERTLYPRSPRRHYLFIPPQEPMLTSTPHRSAVQSPAYDRSAPTTSIRFPLNNFKHFLTLFSKFFSSFPRGTCSLSVSRLYLALDGIYHPIRAAFPNNPTRRQRLVEQQGPRSTGLSPSLTSRSRELGLGPLQRTLL